MCVVIHAVGIPTNNWTLVQTAGHLCHLLGRLWMDMQMRRVQPPRLQDNTLTHLQPLRPASWQTHLHILNERPA